VLLAARGGVERGDLLDLLRAEAPRLAGALPVEGRESATLLRLADDPFARGGPPMRAFEATIELRCRCDDAGATFAGALAGLAGRIAPLVHGELSAALVGQDHAFGKATDTPILFQYFMRRRRDLDHAAYCKHYLEQHSRFGIATPGIETYVQFHVDPEASAVAADAAGVGLRGADSISELHIGDLPGFLGAVARWELRADASEDEARFIDRENSVMWVSERVAL
jgi:hypothetical protein